MRPRKEGGRTSAERRPKKCRLLERGRNRRKGRIKVGAQRSDHHDDGHCYAGSDQAIFDRGRALFIGQEFKKRALQLRLRQDWVELTQHRKSADLKLCERAVCKFYG